MKVVPFDERDLLNVSLHINKEKTLRVFHVTIKYLSSRTFSIVVGCFAYVVSTFSTHDD